MSDIARRVMQIVSEQMGVAVSEVKPEHRLVEDLGADSLDEVELLMAMEDEFDILIEDVDAEKIKTVQDAIAFISSRHPAK